MTILQKHYLFLQKKKKKKYSGKHGKLLNHEFFLNVLVALK